MKKNCQNCSKEFTKPVSDSVKYFTERRRYCSAKCAGIARRGVSVSAGTQFKRGDNAGSKNHAWKSGRRKTARGYIEILVGVKQYRLEHRVIMERYLGRKLSTSEHVHHVNHVRDDNRIENLRLLTAKEHGTMHANERWAR